MRKLDSIFSNLYHEIPSTWRLLFLVGVLGILNACGSAQVKEQSVAIGTNTPPLPTLTLDSLTATPTVTRTPLTGDELVGTLSAANATRQADGINAATEISSQVWSEINSRCLRALLKITDVNESVEQDWGGSGSQIEEIELLDTAGNVSWAYTVKTAWHVVNDSSELYKDIEDSWLLYPGLNTAQGIDARGFDLVRLRDANGLMDGVFVLALSKDRLTGNSEGISQPLGFANMAAWTEPIDDSRYLGFGYPQGLLPRVPVPLLSTFIRSGPWDEGKLDVLFFDESATDPGFGRAFYGQSGGPLCRQDGVDVGTIVGKDPMSSVGFMVESNPPDIGQQYSIARAQFVQTLNDAGYTVVTP